MHLHVNTPPHWHTHWCARVRTHTQTALTPMCRTGELTLERVPAKEWPIHTAYTGPTLLPPHYPAETAHPYPRDWPTRHQVAWYSLPSQGWFQRCMLWYCDFHGCGCLGTLQVVRSVCRDDVTTDPGSMIFPPTTRVISEVYVVILLQQVEQTKHLMNLLLCSPAISLGFTILSEIFVDVTFFKSNHWGSHIPSLWMPYEWTCTYEISMLLFKPTVRGLPNFI